MRHLPSHGLRVILLILFITSTFSVAARYRYNENITVKAFIGPVMAGEDKECIQFWLINRGDTTLDSLEVRLYFDAKPDEVTVQGTGLDTTVYELGARLCDAVSLLRSGSMKVVNLSNSTLIQEVEAADVVSFSTEIDTRTGERMYFYPVKLPEIVNRGTIFWWRSTGHGVLQNLLIVN